MLAFMLTGPLSWYSSLFIVWLSGIPIQCLVAISASTNITISDITLKQRYKALSNRIHVFFRRKHMNFSHSFGTWAFHLNSRNIPTLNFWSPGVPQFRNVQFRGFIKIWWVPSNFLRCILTSTIDNINLPLISRWIILEGDFLLKTSGGSLSRRPSFIPIKCGTSNRLVKRNYRGIFISFLEI